MKISSLLKVAKPKLKSLFQKRVLQNLILVSGVTFLISLLGFFKETVVAANYGLSLQLDTFYVAILIPGVISTVFLGSFRSVFIPNYVNELGNNGNIGTFQTTSLILTIAISLFFAGVAVLGTDTFLELLYPNKTSEFYDLVKKQFYILIPAIFLWGTASLLGALLNINNEFRLSSFSGVFTPIVILLGVYFLKDLLSNTVLAWGTTIGAFFSFIYLCVVARHKKLIVLGKLEYNNTNIKIAIQQIPAKISSSFLAALNPVVDQFFAAQLIIGSIAALNYGIKIPAFLAGLFSIAFSNVLLPYFSNSALNNREEAFNTMFKYVKWVFLGLIIPILIGIALSDFIVELLFQRREFSQSDAEIVGQIQKIFLAYIPFQIVNVMMVNFATSINKNNIMAYYSFGAVFLNVILDYLLIKQYGIFGIALSTTVIIIIKCIGMYVYLRTLKNREFGAL